MAGRGDARLHPGSEGDLEQARAADPGLQLVAETGGVVVGTVTGTYDGRRGWLMRLAVDPAHRRAGVGRALVAELEARLDGRGAPQVNLLVFDDNADALAFWRRLGYGRGVPVRLLSKRLDGTAAGCC